MIHITYWKGWYKNGRMQSAIPMSPVLWQSRDCRIKNNTDF